MSDTEHSTINLNWTQTIENETSVWYALLDGWDPVPSWPFTMAEIRPELASYIVHLTDGDFFHYVWVGYYRTVDRARSAAERVLNAMRTSAMVVLLDDNRTPITVRVQTRVEMSVAGLVSPQTPLSGSAVVDLP